MFSKIIAEAREYTRPVVTLFKCTDGKVESSVGTFIHVDDLGHILSANHIFTVGSEDPIDVFGVIFDRQYSSAEIIAEDVPNDLILLRIKGYIPGSIKMFPKFLRKSQAELSPGTPLVRLGFPLGHPYSHVAVGWNDLTKGFQWDAEKTKLSDFHNEGTVMGYVDRECGVRLLETTSPALMGQSGGPLLTAQGALVGLQSRNTVLELPASPSLETGLATSHIVIAELLEKNGARADWI